MRAGTTAPQPVLNEVTRFVLAHPAWSQPSSLPAVLEAMDTAVLAVQVGDAALLANAAARTLFALPEHRQIRWDDLSCQVQITQVDGEQPMDVDDLPLMRALGGLPVEAEVIVSAARPCARLTPGRRLLLRARPLLTPSGEVSGAVCTAQDLTDLHTQHAVLDRRAAELAALNRVTRALLKEEDARRAVCEAACEVSGAMLAALYEPDGPDLACTTHVGADLAGRREPQRGPCVIAEVFDTGRAVVVHGASRHLAGDQAALDRALGATSGRPRPLLRTGVWLPVMSRGRCMAVLAVGFAAGAPVHEALPVLEILAAETAVAIEREDLLRRLRREASLDGLTGAANRRVWEEELPRALSEAARTREPVAVVMLDLDHFKEYNDSHGHPAGDALLRDVVAAWRVRLFPTDLLCRYGGEEFVLLLRGRGAGPATEIVEELRAVVPQRQTCSAGVAVWDGREPAHALVQRVDAALYAAKLAGRDRVRLAGPEQPALDQPALDQSSGSSAAAPP